MTVLTEPSPPLDYAPPGATEGRWRRRWLRRALAGAALVVFAGLLWTWGPEAWRHATLLYWQRQCMNYEPPADAALDRSSDVKVPAGWPDDRSDYVTGADRAGGVVLIPRCWREFDTRLRGFSVVMVRRRLRPQYQPATIFLHGMTTPSGERRLVRVEGPPTANIYAPALDLDWEIYAPATAWSRPARVTRPYGKAYSGPWGAAQLQVGRHDPKDPTHFTIGYIYRGESGTIDGWLQNNGRMNVVVRDGPATRYIRSRCRGDRRTHPRPSLQVGRDPRGGE
jgi:hypothetical protein